MSKSNIDVAYVAKLARIDVDEKLIPELQKDMEAILEYIDQLSELDVSDIEATAHAAPLHNVAREDELKSFDNREVIIENAPATIEDDLVKVPKVMQAEEESC